MSDGWQPVDYSDVPGWRADDLSDAWLAYRRSLAHLSGHMGLATEVIRAAERVGARPEPDEVRTYFERFFQPMARAAERRAAHGLLTGYFEPELEGSLEPSERFRVPVYARPDDLENVVAETARAAVGDGFSHLRRTASGLVPYWSREEIDRGALAARRLEILWLADEVDAFVLHVQGSGRIRLPDGRLIGLSYDGKNGHPYTSIGRVLIDEGHLPGDGLTLDRLAAWLRSDAERGRRLMWRNKSFVFFKVRPDGAVGPSGADGTPLVPGRSLAVDPAHHRLGLPVFVLAPDLTLDGRPLRRLMFAHDVGSAIKGPERGDYFFGSGATAAGLAGATKVACSFFALVPRPSA